jgi:hypothetical protein
MDGRSNVTNERQSLHPNIEDVLPDYAIGALSDPEIDQVAEHLQGCPTCQAALDDVLVLGAELAPATPEPATRVGLFERIRPSDAGFVPVTHSTAPLTRFPGAHQEGRRRSVARFGLVAAALALIIGLVGWNIELRRGLENADALTIADLKGDASVVHTLRDTQTTTGANAMLYSDPDSSAALLIANDLPPLAQGEEYQVWLITDDGQRERGGRFVSTPEGDAVMTFTAPQPFAAYIAIAVSAEPPNSPEPSSALVVGGWLK